MKIAESLIIRTRYFSWVGDACRLHEHKNGSVTADLYRGFKGIVPISPADLLRGATEVGPLTYQELRDKESAFHERNVLRHNRRVATKRPKPANPGGTALVRVENAKAQKKDVADNQAKKM